MRLLSARGIRRPRAARATSPTEARRSCREPSHGSPSLAPRMREDGASVNHHRLRGRPQRRPTEARCNADSSNHAGKAAARGSQDFFQKRLRSARITACASADARRAATLHRPAARREASGAPPKDRTAAGQKRSTTTSRGRPAACACYPARNIRRARAARATSLTEARRSCREPSRGRSVSRAQNARRRRPTRTITGSAADRSAGRPKCSATPSRATTRATPPRKGVGTSSRRDSGLRG